MNKLQNKFRANVAAFAFACVAVGAASPVSARSSISLPSASLEDSINALSRQARVQILVDQNLLRGKRAPAIRGAASAENALAQLLKGTGLKYQKRADMFLIVRGDAAKPKKASAAPKVVASVPAPSRTEALEPSGDGAIDEIVVTGVAGTGARRTLISYSLSTIDSDDLKFQAPISVADAVRSVPGFWSDSSAGDASGNVQARGIPVDNYGSVNLLEDGMPIQHDPALGYLKPDQSFRLDETIDRIEVVRGGPSPVLYSNAPAGVINFISRRPGPEREGVVKVTAGDSGLFRGDVWIGQPLSGSWSLGIGGFYRRQDGIRNPGFRANDGGQIRATLAGELGDVRLLFDIKHMNDRAQLYNGIVMRAYPDGIKAVPGLDGSHGTLAGPETMALSLRTDKGSVVNDNRLGNNVRRTQFSFRADYEIAPGWSLREQARYVTSVTRRNGYFPMSVLTAADFLKQTATTSNLPVAALGLRYTNHPGEAFDVAGQNGNGLVVIAGLRAGRLPLEEFTNDLQLTGAFDMLGEHKLTLGAYIAWVDQSVYRYGSTVLTDVRNQARLLDVFALNGSPAPGTTEGGFLRHGYEYNNASGSSFSKALYLADEWSITPKLRIDGGLRWESIHTKGDVETTKTVNLGTPATSSMITGSGNFVHYDARFDKVAWTLGANYQFDDRMGVFARYTSANRLPNLASYLYNPTAKPIVQTMSLGEVGYKFSRDWLQLYATAFYTKYNDVAFQNAVFNPVTGISINETGYASTRTVGLEFEGAVRPAPFLSVNWAATFQDPKYRDLKYTQIVAGQPVLRDYVGNQLTGLPKMFFRVAPMVELLDGRLQLQVAWQRQTRRFTDAANSVRLPGFDMYSASAHFRVNDALSLSLYGDNLTNSLGLGEGNPRVGELQSTDAGANTFIARPQLGRHVRLALTYSF